MTFLERSLRDEVFRKDPDTVLAGCILVEDTRSHVSKSCGENIENILKQVNQVFRDLQSEPLVQNLSQSSKALLDDFYYQIGDKKVLNQDLLNDLMLVLLPVKIIILKFLESLESD